MGKCAVLERSFKRSFKRMYMKLPQTDSCRDRNIFHVWSCAAHPRYLPIIQKLYSGTDVVFLAYDCTKASSFTDLVFWYNEVKRDIPGY